MISLCMIVKNEIDVLERCITSVKELMSSVVDELVVVDTGSTDGTRELAVELGCNVYDYEWCKDFAKARNFGVKKAKNDWIIVLDADEFVVDVDIEEIKKLILTSDEKTIGRVAIVNYGDENAENYHISYNNRVFNKNEAEFTAQIHEYLYNKKGFKPNYIEIPLELHHTGYISDVLENKKKTERNIEIIKEVISKEEDSYLVMHLGKSYIALKDYENAQKVLLRIVEDEGFKKQSHYSEGVREYIRSLLLAEKYEEVLECEKFWDRCKDDEMYVYLMGQVYMRNGKFEKAVDCFINVANREFTKMNKVNAIYSLGQLFEVVELYEESAEYYSMCGDFSDAKYCCERVKAKIQ